MILSAFCFDIIDNYHKVANIIDYRMRLGENIDNTRGILIGNLSLNKHPSIRHAVAQYREGGWVQAGNEPSSFNSIPPFGPLALPPKPFSSFTHREPCRELAKAVFGACGHSQYTLSAKSKIATDRIFELANQIQLNGFGELCATRAALVVRCQRRYRASHPTSE